MLTSVLGPSLNPADGSPEGRARAVAAILAAGLLRLRKPLVVADSPPENLSKFRANQLAVLPEKSVTVTAG